MKNPQNISTLHQHSLLGCCKTYAVKSINIKKAINFTNFQVCLNANSLSHTLNNKKLLF